MLNRVMKNGVAVTIVISAMLLTGCFNKKVEEKPVEVGAPVSSVEVQSRNIVETVEISGTLTPTTEVNVGTRNAGRISRILVREGMPVKRGELMATLESQDAEALLRSAEAARRSADARLALARAAAKQQMTTTSSGELNAQSALKSAQARLKQAQAAAKQQITATDSGILSAKAALETANARVEQAKAAAKQQKTATNSGINNAVAAVEAAKARLDQAIATATSTEASLKAAVKSAEATLSATNSKLNALKSGSRTQERKVAENALAVSKANMSDAENSYNRYKELFNQGAITRERLEKYETALNIAKAQFDSAQQQLSLVQEGPRKEDIESAEANVRQAQEGLESARANLGQISVAKANVEIAKTGVRQAESLLETAKSGSDIDEMKDKDVLAALAGVEQAKANLASAKALSEVNIMRDSDVLAAQQAIEQANANIESAKSAKQVNIMRDNDVLSAQEAVYQAAEQVITAKNALSYTKIVASVDGVVSKKMSDVGQALAANISVFTISTSGSLYFEAPVSELDATKLKSGQPVKITVDAMQGDKSNLYNSNTAVTCQGIVERVVPVVDVKSRNFNVRVTLDAKASKDKALYPGMFATGVVITVNHPNSTVVPKDAIVERGGKQYVYTALNNHAVRREVTTGIMDKDGYMMIISGVDVGEQVMVEGNQTLSDGALISVTPVKKELSTPKTK
jgi:HlyD family secretion protein